jgi:hypothetical protein
MKRIKCFDVDFLAPSEEFLAPSEELPVQTRIIMLRATI